MATKGDRYRIRTNDIIGPSLSMWLVPPKDSEIHAVLVNAIARMVPSVLVTEEGHPLPQFEPHLTLDSQISRIYIRDEDFQTWLDNIDLPDASAVDVEFQELAVGDEFNKKLFLRCRQSDSLISLTSACRQYSCVKTPKGRYNPHVSLV
jgi:hypothetical protein